MSSFNKKGLRKDKHKITVKNLKGINLILKQLDEVYNILSSEGQPEVTLDNIADLSSVVMGRDLDHIELMMMKGKFNLNIQDEAPDNV